MEFTRKNFCGPLLAWYEENHRDLPWRHTADPYAIWISEIMLQQTRVEALKGHYAAFLSALPSVRDLAACPDDVLMKLWQGLGYYSRARNLKKAAEKIEGEMHGSFPETYEGILSLPGIGSYTAGAVASIAFGLPEPAVDGNVLRVTARVTGSEENILSTAYKRRIEEQLRDVMAGELSPGEAGSFNQSLIELGAVVCVPGGAPKCGECPLQELCAAYAEGKTAKLPVRMKEGRRRIEERTVLLIRDGDLVAIRKRPPRGLLAGMYEFPSIKGRAGQDEVLADIRGAGAEPLRIRRVIDAKHIFSHVEWHMTGFEIAVAPPEKQVADWIFVSLGEIEEQYAIPSAFSAYQNFLFSR